MEVNTINHYLRDIKQKQLKNFELDANEVKKFEIGTKNKTISYLILKNNSNKWVIALHGFKRNKYKD